MKLLFKLTFLTMLSFLLFSCNDPVNNDPAENDPENLFGKVNAQFSNCLNGEVSILEEDSKTVIEWSYNDGVLNIYHLNAGFNCCLDVIEISFSVDDNNIHLTENDLGEKCHCNCVRDIDYKITDIHSGTYTIKITEGLDVPGLQPIVFQTDLKDGNSGSAEFDRPMYPWNSQ